MFNIKAILQDLEIPFATSGRNIGKNFVGLDCPFCNDGRNHFGISLITDMYTCWKCGKKGHITYFLQVTQNWGKSKVEAFLQDYIDFFIEQPTKINETLEVSNLITEWPEVYLDYIEDRGFDLSIIDKYRLKPFNVYGFNEFRIYIPVILNGQEVCYQARTVKKDKNILRYNSCENEKAVIPLKNLLYNIDTVKEKCCLVEGVFDVFRGGDGFVSSFGIEVTDAQIYELYKRKVRQAFILFDNEVLAQKKAEEVASRLSVFTKVEICQLESAKDLAKLTDEQAEEIRKELMW